MTCDDLAALDELLVCEAERIEDFLAYHRNQVRCPVYASVDVRRNVHKAAVVDANAFPAGFNNLAERSRRVASDAIRNYIARMYPDARRLLILAEGHTRNKGYFENLKTLQHLFTAAGYEVVLGTLNAELFPQATVDALTGDITLHGVLREGDEVIAGGVVPDVVILNNDLADGSPAILDGLAQPVTPPPTMGWHRRRKAEHFRIVNELARQLGAYVGFDGWLVSAEFEAVHDVDFRGRQGIEAVADAVDQVLARVRAKYAEHGISREAHVFVKADPGTYGMGIMTARSGDDVRNMNSKAREKMDRTKGRVKTASVLVQEGVPTDLRLPDGAVAEPVVYMVCGRVVGGFHRSHGEKSDAENLNSPGARYAPFLTTEDGTAGPDELRLAPDTAHVYQVLGEIASIATGYELLLAKTPGAALPVYP